MMIVHLALSGRARVGLSLFTQVPRREILRTSPVMNSANFALPEFSEVRAATTTTTALLLERGGAICAIFLFTDGGPKRRAVPK